MRGFGKIRWIDAAELHIAVDAPAFDELASTVVEAVNRDHAPAADALAHRATGTVELGWELAGLDPDGVDLRRDETTLRYDFDEPLLSPTALLDGLGIERRG